MKLEVIRVSYLLHVLQLCTQRGYSTPDPLNSSATKIYSSDMAWDKLIQLLNKAGDLIKSPKGMEVIDNAFDHEEMRYRAMESVLLRLDKEMKYYLESLKLLATVQENMALILAGFHGTQQNTVAQLYHTAMEDLSKLTINDLEYPYFHTVLGPLEKFNTHCVQLNHAIKKRYWKKADLEAILLKRKELEDFQMDDSSYQLDVADIEAELEERRKSYEYFNELLKTELPKLVEMRIPYLNPLFEAFVKIQLRFFNENFQKISDVQALLDEESRQSFIDGAYEVKMDEILAQINQLTITH